MARLPQPGSDKGQWGEILNEFLEESHAPDGSLKSSVVGAPQLLPNAVTDSAIASGTISEAKLDSSVQAKLNTLGGSPPVESVAGKTGAVILVKGDVGLGNVDNTSDTNKPVSTATQAGLDSKANISHAHVSTDITDSTATGRSVLTATDAAAARTAIGAGTSNLAIGTTGSTAKAGDYTPTKGDVGLGNVDNTSDADKPISTATQTALDGKVTQVTLSQYQALVRTSAGTGGPNSGVNYSSGVVATTLALRGAGGVLAVGNGVAATDAVNKGQLDLKIDTTQKGTANGVASLDANTRVPTGQLGTGTADTTTYLRGDGSWQTVSGGGSSIYITPEDFGAVGDGVADDTAAMTAAIDSAHAVEGAVYLREDRKYRARIDASNKHLHLIGQGVVVVPSGTSSGIVATHTPGAGVAVTGTNKVIIGPVTSKPSPPRTITVSEAAVSGASLSQFKADDVWRITSQDIYEWAGVSSVIGGNVWHGAYFPIMGVSFAITVAGAGVLENDTITGASSGASGLLGSYAPDSDPATGKIIFKWLTGTFQVGENITVGGATVGQITAAGTVLMKGVLDDAYTTSIELRKVRSDLKCIIDGPIITTDSDTDALVGSANRPFGIILSGVVNARINVTFKDSWRAAVCLNSCYQADVDVRVEEAANNATTGNASHSNQPSEQAYGYGVEITGSTERSLFKIHASNVRHAFTTNPATYGSYPSGSEYSMLRLGTQKDNTVTGLATGCWSSGWDTHEGAYRTTFKDCINVSTSGGYRHFSGGPGFQNRAWNTTYINCIDYGSLFGYTDGSPGYATTKMSITRYINCLADGFQFVGFRVTEGAESANHRVILSGCRARGDGQTLNQPYGSVGFEIAGVDAEISNCVAERFTSSPLQFQSPSATYAATYNVRNFLADYNDTPTNSAAGIRVSGTNHTLLVDGLSVNQKVSAPGMPASFVRVISGSPTIRWGNEYKVINTTNNVPWLVVSSGTPVHTRIPGSDPAIHVGATAPALAITDNLWLDTSSGSVIKRYDGTVWG